MNITTVRLGSSAYRITPIGLGCWQFSGGKGLAGSFWKALDQDLVNRIVGAALASGINWFDTAEAYGGGTSERALSTALQAANAPGTTTIATKWMPFGRFARSIGRTAPRRLQALAPFPIALHQIHAPASFSSIERQIDEMAAIVAEGRIGAVGVSNFSAKQTIAAARRLERHGLSLASNQVRYNLIDRRIEHNGVLEAARSVGATIIAYSPLEQGILTGRYHADPSARSVLSGPRKFMRAFRPDSIELTRPLLDAISDVAQSHGATAAQIALAWVIRRHGDAVVAIPGTSSVAQVEGNAAAMTVELSPEEIARIDDLSSRLPRR